MMQNSTVCERGLQHFEFITASLSSSRAGVSHFNMNYSHPQSLSLSWMSSRYKRERDGICSINMKSLALRASTANEDISVIWLHSVQSLETHEMKKHSCDLSIYTETLPLRALLKLMSLPHSRLLSLHLHSRTMKATYILFWKASCHKGTCK